MQKRLTAASREGRGIPGNEALQPHQQRGKRSDNQYFPSFQVKKKRGAAFLEPPPQRRDGTLPCCFHSHPDPGADPELPDWEKRAIATFASLRQGTEAIPNLPAAGSQCSQCVSLCWPLELAPFPLRPCQVCLEDLAALSSGPLCSASRLEEPAPVPTGQCLDMRLETGDTQGDTAPAPPSNRIRIFGVRIGKADRMVLGFSSCEVIQAGRVFLDHSIP